MFTYKLLENRRLLDYSVAMHRSGKFLPNTFVIDFDTVEENARKILSSAKKFDLQIYYMLKQIGRIPEIGQMLDKIGYDGAVLVDFEEYLRLKSCKIKHVGHLAQIPNSLVEDVVKKEPEMITVYTMEKAIQINEAAAKNRLVANLCIKVVNYEKDFLYPGQMSGIEVEHLIDFAEAIGKLRNVRVTAITSFPCFLFNKEKGVVEETHNMSTLRDSKELLNKHLGIDVLINAPSANSVSSMEMVAKAGAKIVEPGHSLTGTSQEHILPGDDSLEKIAYLYLTEISHFAKDKTFAYGGGLYRRSNMQNCLIFDEKLNMTKAKIRAEDSDSIDYHFEIYDIERKPSVGDTVVSTHRTQMFMTRASIVLVSGLSNGKPKLVGRYTSMGEKVD